jgi:hypothetical protein
VTAVIRSENVPDLDPPGQRIVVDCRHGTTEVVLVRAGRAGPRTEDELIALAVARHEAEEGCGCALGARGSSAAGAQA